MKRPNRLFVISLILLITLSAFAQKKVVILHTNDTHSRIEPLPESDRSFPGRGGVERRAVFVSQVRDKNRNVLLLDAGDFLQGTPYFNLFKGEVEIKAMNLLGYDAVTPGNHEFDNGLEVLADLVRLAQFPVVSSNYDFSNTLLAGMIKPYTIINKDGIRIGIIGVNLKPNGLIAKDNWRGMKYLDPFKKANEYAEFLKTNMRCDMVICLSHLGHKTDLKLAEASRNIDIILGGHSHTYMKKPTIRRNMDNREVRVFQTNGRGVFVGRIDVDFEEIDN